MERGRGVTRARDVGAAGDLTEAIVRQLLTGFDRRDVVCAVAGLTAEVVLDVGARLLRAVLAGDPSALAAPVLRSFRFGLRSGGPPRRCRGK